MKARIAALAGWLLFITLITALTTGLTGWFAGHWVGVPLWLAAILLFPRLNRSQLKQIGPLFLIGVIGLLFGLANGADTRYLFQALAGNQMVVAMLIGVSFLRLVATSGIRSNEALPRGKTALTNTLIGTHLFGSVINISAVLIVGDRLRTQSAMTPLQAVTLLRSFAICAFWSPFFAAMGMALISAPGAQLSSLVTFGLPLGLVALLFTAWEIRRSPDAEITAGYPMHLQSLWLPVALAVSVIIAHLIWPEVKVLTLVSLIALLVTLVWLLIGGGNSGLTEGLLHIRDGLPNMAGEIFLFVAAAMLAAGVAATLSSLNLALAPDHFGAGAASVTLLVLVGLAMAGMHPVTSVVLVGGVLAPTVEDPNLLGLTMLMGWSLGVGLSPFSGVQLSLRARYGIGALELLRLNRIYAPVMLATCFAVLWVYTRLTPL
ncbi:hypothetical protein [Marinobacterium litorale]|uniref:hypothetical protein n=1 Tax=Marinobacterium litorale TaxID=404770 RepID=UPI000400C68B|nr:hypothetical protein [Marinobacterium litorale]